MVYQPRILVEAVHTYQRGKPSHVVFYNKAVAVITVQ
jgi:hypothetical protein